jgi:hypothetical protein
MVIARYVIAAIFGAYLLAWVLAVVVLVVLVVVLLISRGPSDTVRGAFRRAVAASQGGSLHTAGQARAPASVAAGLENLRAADPRFDATAFLDGARVAVGAYAMALSAQDDRLLRRYATPGYWQSTSGKEIADGVASWRRHAGARPGSTNQGRVLLDVSWREPQVWNVTLGEQGMDRITVRLAAVMIGAIRHGWQRLEAATHADWEFVRPAGQQTDTGAVMVPRTCHRCGGPYRSDLDDTCPHCGAARPDTQAGWRLDRTYLVVDA